jgi:peptidoglycan/LPS O-acetylase OafA/YrhL
MKKFIVDKKITDYLKGFAILVVYINHFINSYISKEFGGYANGFISIFFILSGYGIFISLTRLSKISSSNFIWVFFKRRFVRIYPLFWIWCILHGFSNGLLGFFALDIFHPKSPWFIPAIIQCYFLSPILFIFFRNMSIRKSLFFMTIIFIVLNILMFNLIGKPFRSIGYCGLFFQHIFLFNLGFILAKFDSIKALPRYILFSFIFLYLIFIQETTPQYFLEFPFKRIIFSFVFPFTAFLFCYSIFSGRIYLPFGRILQSIGKYTYSIYLFHGVGFTMLVKIGLLEKQDASFIGIIIALLLSPVFICIYSILEIIVNEFILGKRDIKNVIKKTKKLICFFNPFQKSPLPEHYTTTTL